MDKHFPGHQIFPSAASKRGAYAKTANGEKLHYGGEFRVKGWSDRTPISLGMTEMDVDMPVRSVRQFIKSGNEVLFYDDHAIIRNKKSGAKIRCIMENDMYYIKVKVDEPVPQPVSHAPESGFGRQAR